MLRRNGDEREPDRILVAADLNGDSEDLIKWTLSRSQAGDVLFLLHVIGPANSHSSRGEASPIALQSRRRHRDRRRSETGECDSVIVCSSGLTTSAMTPVLKYPVSSSLARSSFSCRAGVRHESGRGRALEGAHPGSGAASRAAQGDLREPQGRPPSASRSLFARGAPLAVATISGTWQDV